MTILGEMECPLELASGPAMNPKPQLLVPPGSCGASELPSPLDLSVAAIPVNPSQKSSDRSTTIPDQLLAPFKATGSAEEAEPSGAHPGANLEARQCVAEAILELWGQHSAQERASEGMDQQTQQHLFRWVLTPVPA